MLTSREASSVALVYLSPLVRQITVHLREGRVQILLGWCVTTQTLNWLLNDTGPLVGKSIHLVLESILFVHGVVELVLLLSSQLHSILKTHLTWLVINT